MSAKQRPFKKLYCDWRGAIFVALRGARLAVWLYHYLRSNKEDESWPSISRISRDTGLHRDTVIEARKQLFATGWLVKVEDAKFKTRRVVAVFPQSENPTTENAETQQESSSTQSENPTGGSRKTPTRENSATEVDSVLEVGSKCDTAASKQAVVLPSKPKPNPARKVAASAFKLFCREMGEEDAFKLMLWIIYRAANPKIEAPQIPQSVGYYNKAWRNFNRQYEYGQDSLLDFSWDRFDKYARNFVTSNAPELLEWLEATWAQIEAASQPMAASAAA